MAKAPADIRSLARQHTGTALQTLARIAGDVNAPEEAQVAAANSLLDRGWGKATQIIEATIDDKRDATDWTRAELVAFINDARKGGGGNAPQDGCSEQSDRVH